MRSVTDLRSRLGTARRRLAQATPGSPEWDAAKAEVEEVEAYTDRLDRILERPAAVTAKRRRRSA